MSTVSGAESTVLSLTISWNVNTSGEAPGSVGAVNEGLTVFAPISVTPSPAVWLQEKVKGSTSGSEDSEPSSATGAPSLTP